MVRRPAWLTASSPENPSSATAGGFFFFFEVTKEWLCIIIIGLKLKEHSNRREDPVCHGTFSVRREKSENCSSFIKSVTVVD